VQANVGSARPTNLGGGWVVCMTGFDGLGAFRLPSHEKHHILPMTLREMG
jgi:hypothetical protein